MDALPARQVAAILSCSVKDASNLAAQTFSASNYAVLSSL